MQQIGSDQEFQGTFFEHIGRHSRRLSTQIVGQVVAASRNHSQPPQTIKRYTDSFSLRPHERAIRLQQNAISTIRMQCTSSRESRQKRNMGFPFRRWLVRPNFTRALPNTQMPHQVNQQRSIQRHSTISAQANHKSIRFSER